MNWSNSLGDSQWQGSLCAVNHGVAVIWGYDLATEQKYQAKFCFYHTVNYRAFHLQERLFLVLHVSFEKHAHLRNSYICMYICMYSFPCCFECVAI